MTREEILHIIQENINLLYNIISAETQEVQIQEINSIDNILTDMFQQRMEEYRKNNQIIRPMGINSPKCEDKKQTNHRPLSYKAKMRMRQNNVKRINVYQFDAETGELIGIWPSLREIERKLGYNNSYLSKCCRNKKPTAYGCIWRYSDSIIDPWVSIKIESEIPVKQREG